MGYSPPPFHVRKVGATTNVYGGSAANDITVLYANLIDPAPTIKLDGSTGLISFGTYNATPALASTGYIEIKDAGGTIRRLAVVG